MISLPDLSLIREQYYHSIHARGEKVEAVLKEAENPEVTEQVSPPANRAEGLNVSAVEHVDFEEGQVDDQPIHDHRAKNHGPPVSNRLYYNNVWFFAF